MLCFSDHGKYFLNDSLDISNYTIKVFKIILVNHDIQFIYLAALFMFIQNNYPHIIP
jgi:hypothetical protein